MSIEHARFSDLPRWLAPGDLLVVNTSGTMNAALDATRTERRAVRAARLDTIAGRILDRRVARARRRRVAALPSGARRHDAATSRRRTGDACSRPIRLHGSLDAASRLWMAALIVPDGVPAYLARFGFPIRYGYVKQSWPSIHVSDRVRHRDGQRGDAIGRPAVHA